MAQYTPAVLAKKTKADLTEIADELDLDVDGMTKPQIIEAITDSQSDEELDDEELDDDNEDELDDIEEPELDDDEEQDEVDEEPVKKATKKTKKTTASSTDENTLAAKQVASMIGTDAKTIRQFFRSPASTTEAVGSGGRYEFLETDVEKIKAEFEKWSANRGKRAPAGSGSKKARNAAKVDTTIEEVEEIEELEEAELDELDDDDIELDD